MAYIEHHKRNYNRYKSLPIINVGVDMDGVVNHFPAAFSKVLRKLYGKDKHFIINEQTNIKDWDWTKWYPSEDNPVTKDQLFDAWKYINTETTNFWERVPAYRLEGFNYFRDKIMKLPFVNVYFITSRRQSPYKTVTKQTIFYLKGLGWEDPQVIVTPNKGDAAKLLNLDYFVDDKPSNLIDVMINKKECKAYIMTHLHNQSFEGEFDVVPENLNRILTLKDFADDIMNEVYKVVKKYERYDLIKILDI